MHIAMLGTRAVGDHRQRRRPQLLTTRWTVRRFTTPR